MISIIDNNMAGKMVFRVSVSVFTEIIDIASALAFSLSYVVFMSAKWLNDFFGSYRVRRGFDTNYDQAISMDRVYRMAMECMKAHQSKYNVHDVWNVFPTLSKRQAYKILDEINYLRKEH